MSLPDSNRVSSPSEEASADPASAAGVLPVAVDAVSLLQPATPKAAMAEAAARGTNCLRVMFMRVLLPKPR